MSLDTTALGDGEHAVRLLLEDASGNLSEAWGRTIRINNPGGAIPDTACADGRDDDADGRVDFPEDPQCASTADGSEGESHAGPEDARQGLVPPPSAVAPPAGPGAGAPGALGSLNGRGATSDARLTVRFAGSGRRRLTSRYGRTVPMRGRLFDPAGRGIAGASVEVRTRSRSTGAPMRTAGLAVTDDRGEFRYTAGVGVSRLVRFAYRARLGDPRPARTAELHVDVRPTVRLSLDRRELRSGRVLRYSGRVLGAPALRKVVEIQVRQGSRWRTIAMRSLWKGRFHWRYRFVRTTVAARYAFRVRVRAERGWPFLTGSSPVRRVLVRPRARRAGQAKRPH
jgi:hypothetical protein